MKKMLKNTFITTLFKLLILLAITPAAFAHFHYDIAVTTGLQTEQNKLTALNITFLYGLEVSHVYLDEDPDLNEFAVGLVKDLAPLHYFTEIRLNGKSLPTLAATHARAVKVGNGNNTHLQVSFTLPLAQPVTLNGKSTIALIHKDSTASATLTYESIKNIHLPKSIRNECTNNIREIKNFQQGDQPQIVRVVCDM